MRRVLGICIFGLIALALPRIASAGSIIDPIIGVRGGNFGSLPLTDPSFNVFGSCAGFADDLLAAGFSCLIYDANTGFDLAENGLTSLVLQIQDLAGENASNFQPDQGVTCGEYYSTYCSPREGSEFNVTDLLMNGLVQLTSPDGPLMCGGGSIESDSTTTQRCEDAIVYIKPLPGESLAFQAAVREVNGHPVPEPATLLLMGTGLTALAGRRLRRKKTN